MGYGDKTVCQNVYEVLFDRIIAGKLSSGTRLKEVALAGEFRTSRTPVREALRQLAQDGLVRIAPSQGAQVIPFTADDIEDVYDIRLALELLAIDIAGETLRLQRLADIRYDMLALTNDHDFHKHADMDRTLHDYLVECTQRRYLMALYDQTSRLMQRFRNLGFMDTEVIKQATREHVALIEPLLVRDLDAARAAMKHHIDNSKRRALKKLNEDLSS